MLSYPVSFIIAFVIFLLLSLSRYHLLYVWLLAFINRLRTKKKASSSVSDYPTQKPECSLCEAKKDNSTEPKDPPPIVSYSLGRPRSVDTSMHYCPNPECPYYGWIARGNICSNGHPSGGRWRQLKCTVCGTYFMETQGTPFYRSKTDPKVICRALKALGEGVDIHATWRIFEVDPDTVQDWLKQAAEHQEAVSRYLIHDLQLTQVQLDELWALLGSRQQTDKRNKCWVWSAIDPVSKLWLTSLVGDRSLKMAQALIHTVVSVLASACVPLFLSDQWSSYAKAILTHFGHYVDIPRRYKRGRPPLPRWMPIPSLQYAQLVKQRIKGHVVSVSCEVVYGSMKRRHNPA